MGREEIRVGGLVALLVSTTIHSATGPLKLLDNLNAFFLLYCTVPTMTTSTTTITTTTSTSTSNRSDTTTTTATTTTTTTTTLSSENFLPSELYM